MLFAQLSDLHVTPPGERLEGVVDTPHHLRRAIAALLELSPRPVALLLTGDLTERGSAAEYAYLRQLLVPFAGPIYVIPGNHDAREALRAAFADCPWIPAQGFVQYVIDAHPVRLIALDTVVAGQPHGELDAVRLAWLAARLGETPEQPTLLLMHHPPFDTGIGHMDSMALMAGRDEFIALVAQHPQVQAIACGHVHRAAEALVGGTLAAICPSPAHQIALDFAPDSPAAFIMEPGGYRLWRWDGATLVSHVAVVGDFGGARQYA